MSLDPSSLESDLRKLRAAALDESLLARLEACTRKEWTQLEPAEAALELHLRGIPPASLPSTLAASLEATLSGVQFPANEKILRFPKQETRPTRHSRSWWSAAAAVALTGAVTALLMPVNPAKNNLAKAPHPPVITPHSNQAGELVPAGFNRALTEARDEGVLWKADDQPHRVVKVVYMDHLTLKDASGRICQVDQPRVEYILVPEKAD